MEGVMGRMPKIAFKWLNRLAELLEIAELPYRHWRFIVIARSLLDPLPDLPAKIKLDIRPMGPADLEWVRQIDRPSEARASARRLERGHIGLLALYQGQPAGYAWACAEVELSLERVQLKLEPGDMLCVDAYTAPPFRGKGIQTALSLARLQLFRDQGYHRAIAYIEQHNAPSLAVWRKLGGREISRIDFLRVGPWRRTRYLLSEPVKQRA
jgi:GNAT superfamily N-acetyltransferase